MTILHARDELLSSMYKLPLSLFLFYTKYTNSASAFTFTLQISLNAANNGHHTSRIKESHNTCPLLFKTKYAQRQNSHQWKRALLTIQRPAGYTTHGGLATRVTGAPRKENDTDQNKADSI